MRRSSVSSAELRTSLTCSHFASSSFCPHTRQVRLLSAGRVSSALCVAHAHHGTSSVRRRISCAFMMSSSLTAGKPWTSTHVSALLTGTRGTMEIKLTKTSAVQYVGILPAEMSKGGGEGAGDPSHSGADTLGEEPSGDADLESSTAVEPSVVDFTEDKELQKLDKHYQRSSKGAVLLSKSERSMFRRMIYNQFYKDEGTTVMDPAMLYQAALEVQWVEEWMATKAGTEHLSEEAARRAVKMALLERVDLHKPLSYIIGSQPFFGCEITCVEPLLCPRPETEMWTHWLVYNFLSRLQKASTSSGASSLQDVPLRMLDMCCGTGCIGVSLAKHVPSAAVTALDLLPLAVTVSNDNARRNGVDERRYRAVQSDMFDFFLEQFNATPSMSDDLSTCADEKREEKEEKRATTPDRSLGTIKTEYVGVFDVVVSNPPYVLPDQYIDLPRTITRWESKTALVGDDYRESRQYLYFKELCVHGAKLLKPQHLRPAVLRDTPNLLIEVGLQAHMVAELMEKSKLWKDVNVHLDYAQQERWVSAVSVH